jgi:hypothetical protein
MPEDFPYRCPRCHAQVVDRRSPTCTTCHQALPVEWIMTAGQRAKTEAIDREIKAQHAAAMKNLDPVLMDPDAPTIVRLIGNIGPPV